MTREEFDNYNKTKSMPQFWIGQGSGYKLFDKEWKDIADDEIIYIPEYAYENEGYVERVNAFSKADFIELVREYKEDLTEEQVDNEADGLFCFVDWQFPFSVIDEGWFDEE